MSSKPKRVQIIPKHTFLKKATDKLHLWPTRATTWSAQMVTDAFSSMPNSLDVVEKAEIEQELIVLQPRIKVMLRYFMIQEFEMEYPFHERELRIYSNVTILLH